MSHSRGKRKQVSDESERKAAKMGLFSPTHDELTLTTIKLAQGLSDGFIDAVELHLKKQDESTLEAILNKKIQFSDSVGRTFHDITLLQYLLWTKDKFMRNMLAQYMSAEAIQQQTKELEDHGIKYVLDDEQYQEQHFNFDEFLAAYQALHQHVISNPNDIQTYNKLLLDVGNLQKMAPIHVLGEILSKVPFSESSAFDQQPSFEHSFLYFDWMQKMHISPYQSSRLGNNHMIERNPRSPYGAHACYIVGPEGVGQITNPETINQNIKALKKLQSVRDKDLQEFKEAHGLRSDLKRSIR